MRRREFLKYSAATAAAAPSVRAARADSGVVNVGIVSQKLAPSHPARHSRVSAL
jgi:TAT (twin-arginine translocation) pathway signal sequence